MGWRLLEEVTCARPQKPGVEWWTLVDIALDARDETRQSMCGQDYLMERAKCSKATLYRRLDALTAAGLITTVRRAAPGVRAIYEIAQLHGTGLSVLETRSPVDKRVSKHRSGLSVVETSPETDGSHNPFERVSKHVRTGLTNAETHTVISSVNTPSHVEVLELDGSEEPLPAMLAAPVETGAPRFGQPRWISPIELAAQQAAEARQRRAETGEPS